MFSSVLQSPSDPKMTLQTPQSLRARASNIALRLKQMGIEGENLAAVTAELDILSSSASSAAASLTPSSSSSSNPPAHASPQRVRAALHVLNPPILTSLSGRTPVCRLCLGALEQQSIISGSLALSDTASCALCAVMASEPAAFTKPFCSFLTENPTVWHAVDYFKQKLLKDGYTELSPRDDWGSAIKPGGRYFTTRNGSSLIAFAVGKAYKPGNGIAMIAGHVDAVTARLKPVSKKPTREGYVQLGVAPYAGGLNETWWDRDLSIGGRVVVRDPSSGKTSARLVKLDWPIARVPTLAPHFGVGIMGQNNKETQAVPIIGLDSSSSTSPEKKLGPDGCFVRSQPPRLVELIASRLGLGDDYGSILSWDLELYDSQPAQTGGLDREFIFAGRIDDKLCSWAALTALLTAEHSDADPGIKLVALFDDEEIGSLLRQGARGNFLPGTVARIVEALALGNTNTNANNVLGQTHARSFLLSADVIHAVNPNFAHLYLADHAPRLNVGVALSADSNGHMTTDGVSTAIAQRIGHLGGGAVQTFMIRNDSRSGGTVGPMLSSAMGVRAADAGLPQLSMHSVRATTGALDPGLGVRYFKTFLDKWAEIDAEWVA